MMMMAERIRNVLLRIIGFAIGIIVTIFAVYLFGATALIIIICGCITLAIRSSYKRLTNEIEDLKEEINRLKNKE